MWGMIALKLGAHMLFWGRVTNKFFFEFGILLPSFGRDTPMVS